MFIKTKMQECEMAIFIDNFYLPGNQADNERRSQTKKHIKPRKTIIGIGK